MLAIRTANDDIRVDAPTIEARARTTALPSSSGRAGTRRETGRHKEISMKTIARTIGFVINAGGLTLLIRHML